MEFRKTAHADAQRLLDFYVENRTHLALWEPERSDRFYTLDYWQEQMQNRTAEMQEGRAVYFMAVDDRDNVGAVCNLTNIVRGVFQAGYMGYAVAKTYQGQGIMKALCVHVVDYAFEELQLNRVMSNYLPHNERSGNLLKSLGFGQEGYARRYLKINGHWEDHILTAKINPANL
ncbi:GNAT family N-acetyltransferase [Cellvibrio mixtus]|uniref:GNAT family N-acetyltransferase n=1 Tax=Cellvibrio mixtus TaxID=39650 RepID=UPI0005877E1E|nr:GNAT family N-acetyltransferase [Cellvibrio mixtus]